MFRKERWGERAAFCVLVACVAFLPAAEASAGGDETVQRAADEAIAQLAEQLNAAELSDIRNVAVLPLAGDGDGYITTGLRSAVTGTDLKLITRESETWEMLLDEFEQWSARRQDVMDPETVQEFGKIQGVDAILYGRVWDNDVNMWSIRGHVKVTAHLADVETGQVAWSSGPVEGEAFIHWTDALTRFWRYPLLIIGILIVLLVLLLVIHKIRKAVRHATRPL